MEVAGSPEDVEQGISLLCQYVSSIWEEELRPLAGTLAPYPDSDDKKTNIRTSSRADRYDGEEKETPTTQSLPSTSDTRLNRSDVAVYVPKYNRHAAGMCLA